MILNFLIRLVSFDIPSYDFRRNVFEERFEHLLEKIAPDNPFNISFKYNIIL